MDIINSFIDFSTNFIYTGGIFFGIFLAFIESFLPILPLSVFVALNCNAFGFLLGVLLSWIGTCLGGISCYYLFKFIGNKLHNKFKKKIIRKVGDGIKNFSKLSFTNLVLLYTIPFSPCSLFNTLGGLSNMNSKKFISGMMLGNLFGMIFWGYVGITVIESLTDIKSLIAISILLLVAYVVSKLISKKLNIE